jgi:hypothetical protein
MSERWKDFRSHSQFEQLNVLFVDVKEKYFLPRHPWGSLPASVTKLRMSLSIALVLIGSSLTPLQPGVAPVCLTSSVTWTKHRFAIASSSGGTDATTVCIHCRWVGELPTCTIEKERLIRSFVTEAVETLDTEWVKWNLIHIHKQTIEFVHLWMRTKPQFQPSVFRFDSFCKTRSEETGPISTARKVSRIRSGHFIPISCVHFLN